VGQTHTTFEWNEFVQTMRVVGNTVIITGRWVYRSLTIPTDSRTHPCQSG